MPQEISDKGSLVPRDKILFWAFAFIALLPWLYFRLMQTLHPDILWLCEAMDRVFHGFKMSEAAYETNLPLSLLLYIIPVLLKNYAALPLHLTVPAQSFLILLAGAVMLYRTLRVFPFLQNIHIMLSVFGYIIANTICATILFGERDHLIGMILPPFVLMQLAITYKLHKLNNGDRAFMLLGSVLILLKPHHGLIPSLLLVHRAIRSRSLSVLRDADFLALSLATLAYIGIVWVFFRDYIDIIFPDVIRYYYPGQSNPGFLTTCSLFLGFGVASALVIRHLWPPGQTRALYLFLTACGALSLIPVIVQGKGFAYHYLPVAIFYGCIAATLLYEWLLSQSGRPRISLATTGISVFLLAYLCAPLDPGYAHHGNYAKLPLPREIQNLADSSPHKSFYLFNDDIALAPELSYYTGLEYASRFPSLWFLPGLYYYAEERDQGRLSYEDSEKLQQDIERFGNMIGEDIERYKPAVIAMIQPRFFENKIDPIAFFSANQTFRRAWAPYSFAGTMTVDESAYYGRAPINKRLKVYNIYKRVDAAQNKSRN